ncbi:hypothetical protein JJD41_13275 [Oxynema sp. CENA135]|jgi:hypothetical protein|uniref:hypothetical protein n=1 Tax=Oxynema sp. CENA135 TaxID=984206 RepID=UPI0019091730|nr:hypothetical protein [Oxynema sp. CENA135]MBK4730825.1 hypothetical protein [Oxynema sp. CENA135]
MLPHEFLPLFPTPTVAGESLEAAQITRDFYREVQYRQEFDRHCQWYYETAERHRQELEKMRGDLNLFGWFLRGRR